MFHLTEKLYRAEFDALLEKFSLNSDELHAFMKESGCFVAGGAAVHLLLGKSADEFDGDLDIWYPGAPLRDGACAEEVARKYSATIADADKFFAKFSRANHGGFGQDGIAEEYTDKSNSLNSEIRKVDTYCRLGQKHVRDSQKAQIIYAYGDRERILNSFDYSFCAVGYDPVTGQLFAKELEMTKNRKGYEMVSAKNEARRIERLKKYESRGFKLVTSS